MGSVFDTFFQSIFKFITLAPELGCEPGYLRSVEKNGTFETVRCVSSVTTPQQWTDQQVGGNGRSNLVFIKPTLAAEDWTMATGRSCPPGTYNYGGLCERGCPKYYTRQEVIPRKKDPSDPTGNKLLPPEYQCVAECDNDWHELTWGNTNSGQQRKQANPLMCYHKPPSADIFVSGSDRATDNELADSVQMPFNLSFEAAPRNIEEINRVNENGKFTDDKTRYEAAGVYALRRKFGMSAATPPMPCVPPNIVTESGRCVRPCREGWTLIGDDCVETSQTCPTGSHKDEKNLGLCRIDYHDMPMGPSIMLFLAGLLIISVAGAIAIKAIRARNS
jgi:hypothetical protein